jgi:hypothetical protein
MAVKLATQHSGGTSAREHVMLGTHLVVRKSVRQLDQPVH